MASDPDFSVASVFAPSSNRLLDLLRAQVDDELLWDIADDGRGNHPEENFPALKQIRDTGIVPAPIDWVPGEVLSLSRHGNPDEYWRRNPERLYRWHLERAFACAIFVRAGADPESIGRLSINDPYNVAQLLQSALFLGSEALNALGALITWRFTDAPYRWEREDWPVRPYVALGLLVVAVAVRLPEEQIAALAEWVLVEEAAARAEMADDDPDYGQNWQMGQFSDNLDARPWRPLGIYLRDQLTTIENEGLRKTLEALAARFRGRDPQAE